MRKGLLASKLHLAAAVMAVALMATTTGCDVPDPYPATPSSDAVTALDQLEQLPSLEDTTTQVQAAIDEIAAAATRLLPGIVWSTATNADKDNCQAPYEQSDGQRYFLPNEFASWNSLSEDEWATLLQVARDAAAKLGATDVQVMKDQPGNHDVWFSGPAGVFIKFSYRNNLVIAGYTGCRLPEGKRPPASP